MIVREFKREDFPQLLVLAEQMHKESPNFSSLEMNNKKLVELGESIIKRPDMMCGLVALDPDIQGFIMGVISEYWFSYQHVATDLGLFVSPTKRGGRAAIVLIRGYEKWAWAHGAEQINLGITTGVNHLRTVSLYEKLGFYRCGTVCKKMKGV